MISRKPKFVGKKTKWEKKRIARRFGRNAQGKLPLVEPLTIAPVSERQEALRRGEMVFYDNGKKVAFPLFLRYGFSEFSLQGVFRTNDGKIITIRCQTDHPSSEMFIFEQKSFARKGETCTGSWFSRRRDLGHMELAWELRGSGLGLKSASKAEREIRARQMGVHSFPLVVEFERLYKKLGYQTTSKRQYGADMQKSGKFLQKDDLDKFHRIEAIDPKTGKARIFTFPIKQN